MMRFPGARAFKRGVQMGEYPGICYTSVELAVGITIVCS